MSIDRSAASAFGSASPHVIALDRVLTQLEAVEQRLRSAEAEKSALLVEAFDIAALEGDAANAAVPTGTRGELAYRAVRAEVATCLQMSERTVERQLSYATVLQRDYSRVSEAFADGQLSYRHTSVIIDAGVVIGPGADVDTVMRRAAYETSIMEVALTETPTRLAPIARRMAEQCAKVTLDERHAEARTRRSVSIRDLDDGMADLIAHLPVAEAHSIFDRLTRMSRQIEESQSSAASDQPDPPAPPHHVNAATVIGVRSRHTRGAMRADLLTSLVLSGIPRDVSGIADETSDEAAGLAAVRAHVQVVIPIATLGIGIGFGIGTEVEAGPGAGPGPGPGPGSGSGVGVGVSAAPAPVPATDDLASAETSHTHFLDDDRREEPWFDPVPVSVLAGSGPIDTESARQLASHADHWSLVRVNQDSGTVISVDRYRPSKQMRRMLRARDQRCRFPGCSVALARCDIDHTIDAAFGGPTATDNLAHLCRAHHTLKHHSGWHVTQRGDGELTWTSPTGRRRTDRSPGRVTFVEVNPESTDDHADSEPQPF